MNFFKTKKAKEAFHFILGGVCLILFSILLHIAHLIKTDNEIWLFLNELISQLSSHIGIGFLAIGILTFVLDLSHWTEYFEKRLSNIVINKGYLQKLNTQDLINLQTEVLKVYFKNDEIGGNEGLLSYYQKNVQNIIDKPFRVDVSMNMRISIYKDNPDKLEVFETLTYRCMSNSRKIQENICYIPEANEHDEALDYSVTLLHEDLKKEDNERGEIKFNLEALKENKACLDINKGFNLSIEEYNKNGLSVVVNAHYLVSKYRFFGWRMSHPTHRLTMSIDYPIELKLAKEFYFTESNSYLEQFDEKNGNYLLKINDWMLTDEGIAFQFLSTTHV